MELPDTDSVVPTELQCDIQPGALRQRYSVQWKQIFNENSYIIANEGMFNLTLNVSSSLNGSQYQCKVTIDHDGTIIRDYDGVLTTIVTTTGIYYMYNIFLNLSCDGSCMPISSAHLQTAIMLWMNLYNIYRVTLLYIYISHSFQLTCNTNNAVAQ